MAFESGETKVNSKQHEKGKETEGDGLFQTVDKALLLQGFAIVGTAFLI